MFFWKFTIWWGSWRKEYSPKKCYPVTKSFFSILNFIFLTSVLLLLFFLLKTHGPGEFCPTYFSIYLLHVLYITFLFFSVVSHFCVMFWPRYLILSLSLSSLKIKTKTLIIYSNNIYVVFVELSGFFGLFILFMSSLNLALKLLMTRVISDS